MMINVAQTLIQYTDFLHKLLTALEEQQRSFLLHVHVEEKGRIRIETTNGFYVTSSVMFDELRFRQERRILKHRQEK